MANIENWIIRPTMYELTFKLLKFCVLEVNTCLYEFAIELNYIYLIIDIEENCHLWHVG